MSPPPKVFISYSHDSPEHRDRVLGLANRLRDEGIDAMIDRYVPWPDEGWLRWMRGQIEAADRVLVICTETYRRRFEGTEERGKGRGANYEGAIISQSIYDADSRQSKYVPVLMAGGQYEHIPLELRRWTYFTDTADGYESLYRLITDQPEVVQPGLGSRRVLPPVDIRPALWNEAGDPAYDTGLAVLAEHLPRLAERLLESTTLADRSRRDQFVDDLKRSCTGFDVGVRADDVETDLVFVLRAIYRSRRVADEFPHILIKYYKARAAQRTKEIQQLLSFMTRLKYLRSLLASAGMDRGQLRHIYKTAAADPQRAPDVVGLDDMLWALSRMLPPRAGAVSPLIAFAERVSRRARQTQPVPDDLCRDIARWVDEAADDPVSVLELRRMVDAEVAPALPFEYLIVDVPQRYPERLECWRYGPDNRLIAKTEQPCERTLAGLRDAVDAAVREAKKDVAELVIEIFVPADMLESDADRWPVDVAGSLCPVGELHPVVLRWHERACGQPGTEQPLWKALAVRWPTAGDLAVHWFSDGYQLSMAQLRRRIADGHCGNCFAFEFVPVDPSTKQLHQLLRWVLVGGMSFGVWLRQVPEAWQPFQQCIQGEVARHSRLAEVPGRVRDLRCEACNQPAQHGFLEHLTLFWDDPARNPLDGALEPPGQRGG